MDDNAEQLERLTAKLASHRIHSTLAFAGLYQLTHEMIKRSVLVDVQAFFGYTKEFGWIGAHGQESYDVQVLSLVPKKPFDASLQWLVGMEAITVEQATRLDAIYAHRHDLTHELGKYLIDVNFEPDVDLFIEALQVLKSISRFFTQVEMGIGSFEDHPEPFTIDDVTPLSLIVLQMCVNAYVEGLGDQP